MKNFLKARKNIITGLSLYAIFIYPSSLVWLAPHDKEGGGVIYCDVTGFMVCVSELARITKGQVSLGAAVQI